MPRDSSGNYTLPTGNPVVPGTVIESAWANSTASDIAIQLNNLITRDGLLGPTAPILFPNGTVGLPSIAFALSPSTGLYRYTPNNIGLSIAGVQRQAWDATGSGISGNFGVTGTLGVTGDVTLAGNINIAGNASFAGHMLLIDGTAPLPAYTFTSDVSTGMFKSATSSLGLSTAGVIRMQLDANGNVCIGDTVAHTPRLYITTSAVSVAQLNCSTSTGGYSIFSTVNVPFAYIGVGSQVSAGAVTDLGIRAEANMLFATNGSGERMRLNNIGLGIGIVPTTYKLDISGGGARIFNDGGLRLLNTANSGGGSIAPIAGAVGITISADAGPMNFFAGGTQRVVFDAAGNVSIGPGNPGYALFVGNGNFNVGSPYPGAGATPLQKYMVFSAIQSVGSEVAQAGLSVIYNRLSDTDYGSNLLFLTANDNVAIERMRIDNSGNVGIGLTPNVNGVSIQRNGSAVLKLKGVSSGAGANFQLVGNSNAGLGVQVAWVDDSSGETAQYALGMNVGGIGNTDWGLYSYLRSQNELTMSQGRLLLGRAAALPSVGVGAINIRNDTDSVGDWYNFIHIQNLGSGSGDTNSYVVGGIAFSSFRDIALPSVVASIYVERQSQVGGLASSGQIVLATAQTGGTGPTSPIEKMRIPFGGFPVTISNASNTARYEVATSPGSDSSSGGAAIPLGAIIAGRANGTFPATALGGTVAFSGSVFINVPGLGGGAATSVTVGTWRFIGHDTNSSNLDVSFWIRIG